MFSRLVEKMAEREGVTEQLKVDNQLEWVQEMNNIRNRAVEMVNVELIYAQLQWQDGRYHPAIFALIIDFLTKTLVKLDFTFSVCYNTISPNEWSAEMTISYDKLWKMLIDKKMNRTELKDSSGVSFNVLAKMGRNEFVSMESLMKICATLNCNIGDIVDFLPGSEGLQE